MQQSSIFIRHLTVVDCAIVMPDGSVSGDSFHPSFIITGPVTEDEQVVIDFGKCKKRIKAIIDDYENGFDHKLWVIDGYSGITQFTDYGSSVFLLTPNISVSAPKHTFKKVDGNGLTSLVAIASRAFEIELTEALQKEFPGVSVECKNNRVAFTDDNYVRFNYAHFLPSSSSLPCKRCWHGHGSFIESDCVRGLLEEIGEEYKDVVFINRKYLSERANEYSIKVKNDLGDQYMSVISANHKVIVLDVDTTIENITAYIAEKHKDQIVRKGGTYLAVSEGLSKGAVVKF